jgi:hypothetical protein
MKVHLLHPDRDFDQDAPLTWHQADLVRDLALDRLFAAMALDDEFLDKIARRVILTDSPVPLDTVRYRQDALQDACDRPQVVRTLFALASEAVVLERKHYLGTLSKYPSWVMRWGIDLIGAYLDLIVRLRDTVDRERAGFRSQAFNALFDTLQADLSDDYLEEVRAHLADLKFPYGVTLTAVLGDGAKGVDYRLLRTPTRAGRWWERWIPPRPGPFGFSIHPRDEAGAQALGELRSRGTALVAVAVGQSADHIRNFFVALRTELAFYVGCLNLHETLQRRECPVVRPSVNSAEAPHLAFRDLRDTGLVLAANGPVIGNDLPPGDPRLIVVTGANQGGKSTFLRSLGMAQLMTQAGMFVTAAEFASSLGDGVFTHHKREEDPGMSSGKLDEELKRMSQVVEHLGHQPMVLFNESFAATNEREGSEIARQVLTGLLEHGARVLCVTHLYELAHSLAEAPPAPTVFLRADRSEDGARSFKLVEGPPLETSFGDDLYRNIFGEEPMAAAPT